MNSRIPGAGTRVENLVVLAARSGALLAKEPALADLAPKLEEANGRLERADAARKAARMARFGARTDRDLAERALVTVVRAIQYATLLECGGTRSHATYRALFPKGQAPLVQGPPDQRMAELGALETRLREDPAHADQAKRLADATTAWKVMLDAEVAAHATEAAAAHSLAVARQDWFVEYATTRSATATRLRSVQAAKAFFPSSVRKANDGDAAEAVTPAGDAPAAGGPASAPSKPLAA